MARKPRVHFPGALYHVMLRGNDGQEIFFDSEDRETFSSLTSDGVKRFGHKIYAYCWMANHIHIAVEIEKVPLSNIIQNLAFRYTRYINKKKRRIGHLFQGRYKAILVDKESYLLELIRYIHLNPIRAKLTKKLQDYRYCGHRAYLGIDKIGWLKSDEILSMFGKNKHNAIKQYLCFIEEGIKEGSINLEIGQIDKRIIGDEDFIEKINLYIEPDKEDEIVELSLIIQSTCSVLNISQKELLEKTRRREVTFARNLIAYLNKQCGNSTMSSLAKRFSLDVSTLSGSVVKLEKQCNNLKITKIVKEVKKRCENS